MKEQEIQRAIMDWLSRCGIFHWRAAIGGVRVSGIVARNPMKGHPDIGGVLKPTGRYFTVEVKAAKGVLSADQERWRDRLIANGVLYVLARSVDDVRSALSGHSLGSDSDKRFYPTIDEENP